MKEPRAHQPACTPPLGLQATRSGGDIQRSHGVTRSPDGVQNVAVLEDPQELVVRGDFVEVGSLLVGEEQVRFPDGVQHGRVQVQGVVRILGIGQPGVVPLLTEEDVDAVILQTDSRTGFEKVRTRDREHKRVQVSLRED